MLTPKWKVASAPARERSAPSLRIALVLRTLVPLFLVLGAASVFALLNMEREVEARMQEDVELVARSLRLPITHALERERDGAIAESLRSALDIRRVYSARVYGPDGKHLVSFGAGSPEEPAERVTDLAEAGEEVSEYSEAAGNRVYSYLLPLSDVWGQSLGVLHLTRRGAEMDASIHRLRLQAGGLFLLGMALVTVLVLRGHHRAVGRPLDRLRESMARVRAGERHYRADPRGPKEIGEVALAFNSMVASIQEAEEQLDSRRRAQEALRSELAHAEKLAAVGELAGGVAHELGSPLSVIDGTAQRALRDDGLSTQERQGHEQIRVQVLRMQEIVRQLLEFGRRDTGRRRDVPIADVVRGAVSASAEDAGRRDVTIGTEGPTPSPVVHADRRRLEEAVTNVIRNACQAAGAGGRVRARWGSEDGWALLDVEDDGPGMPEGVASRAFEPFYTTKATGDGSGLGLAVVHGVVDGLGGTVTADTATLGGARIVLRIPCADQADCTLANGEVDRD